MKTLMALAFCANMVALAANADDPSIPVDGDFQDGDVRWEGDVPGVSYIFVWDFRVAGEWVYLCGAGKFTDPTTRQITQQLLRKSYVDHDGKKVLKDISFFAKAPYKGDLRTAKATCRATTVPAKGAGGHFTLQLAGGNYRL